MNEELSKIDKKVLNAIFVTLFSCKFETVSPPKNFKTSLVSLIDMSSFWNSQFYVGNKDILV